MSKQTERAIITLAAAIALTITAAHAEQNTRSFYDNRGSFARQLRPKVPMHRRGVAQAHQAIDTYFDFLEKSVASFPSGVTDFGEKLKVQSVQNIAAVHELVKRLSQAKNFEEAFRIQTAFMHSQLNALGKQAASFGETYAKEAAGGVKLPFKSSSD